MALKRLFGKLVTEYGDDAAKLIATKGDDVARAVATKGDDVLRAADNVDDFLPTNGVWKRVNDNLDEFVPYDAFDGKMPVPDFPDPKAQSALKDELKANRWFKDRGIAFKDPTMDFMGYGTHEYYPTTYRLEYNGEDWGDTRYPGVDRMVPSNSIRTIKTPEIPRKWVSQQIDDIFELPNYDFYGNRIDNYDGRYAVHTEYAPMEYVGMPEGVARPISTEYRPHHNTALWRWYDNKVREAQSLEMSDPGIDYDALRAQWDADSEEVTKFLDTEDMLGRVRPQLRGHRTV